ncbi:helix-turn-helix transcriptional regulator, partial [Mesorhizobium sp. B1-1-5]
MDDPQRELKQWLAEKVSPHGEAIRLSQATGLSSDKITRSKELESSDPKKRRTLQYEEIRAIAMYFKELPPGYE